MISTSYADGVAKQVSDYINNIIPGEGDTEVSIDIRENFKPDYSILAVSYTHLTLPTIYSV